MVVDRGRVLGTAVLPSTVGSVGASLDTASVVGAGVSTAPGDVAEDGAGVALVAGGLLADGGTGDRLGFRAAVLGVGEVGNGVVASSGRLADVLSAAALIAESTTTSTATSAACALPGFDRRDHTLRTSWAKAVAGPGPSQIGRAHV